MIICLPIGCLLSACFGLLKNDPNESAQETTVPYTRHEEHPPIQPEPQIPTQIQQDRTKYEKYPRKGVLCLSVTVIVLGILCVLFGIVDIIINGRSVAVVGAGIWGGAFFILVGSFGMMAAKKATTCWIETALTMSIIGAVVSIGPLMVGSIGWISSSEGLKYYYYRHQPDIASLQASVAMNAMIVFAALTVGILLIITSALSCYGLCSGKSSNRPRLVAGQLQYIPGPDGQQQMVIIPMNQGASYTPGQQVVANTKYQNPQALTLSTVAPTVPFTTRVIYP